MSNQPEQPLPEKVTDHLVSAIMDKLRESGKADAVLDSMTPAENRVVNEAIMRDNGRRQGRW